MTRGQEVKAVWRPLAESEPRGLDQSDPFPYVRRSTEGYAMGTHKDILRPHPGEKPRVNELPDGRMHMLVERPSGRISGAFNSLKRENGPSLSIHKMNEIIARGWAQLR